MDDLWLWLGRIVGAVGVLVCAGGVIARLSGMYFIAGFQTGTLLLVGTAATVVGCYFLLLGHTRRH